jgi:SAM-dependent methyltransferase
VPGLSDPAFVANKRLPVHRWVPWIAGFSSLFAAEVLRRRLGRAGTVLDPFCGVGTTLVEALRHGHRAVGFEINPYAALAARTKGAAHHLDPGRLEAAIRAFGAFYHTAASGPREPRSRPPERFRTRGAFYSPRVLRKVLLVLDFLTEIEDAALRDVFRLALGATLVRCSNYSYEPSLGRRAAAGRPEVLDFDVGGSVRERLEEILADVRAFRDAVPRSRPPARVLEASFFEHEALAEPGSVDLVLTSPPYLNNYHYNRNTRPHLYWLGLVEGPDEMRGLEQTNFGKYWQTVRERQRVDLCFELPGSSLPERIERLRGLHPEKGVYGGRGWANYAAAYFNDCHRLARGLMRLLRPGGVAFVVIGNSILQGVPFATDRHLAEICAAAGLEVKGIEVPRPARVGSSIIQSSVRVGRAGLREQLYEAVVELRSP